MGCAAIQRVITPWDLQVDTYYDAHNPDGSGGYPANASALSSIADLGRKGNTQAQASGSLQPTFVRNAVNSYPGFNFSGAQSMSCAQSAGNTYVGSSSFFVLFSTTNAVPSPTQRLLTRVNTFAVTQTTNTLLLSLFGAGSYNAGGTPISNNTYYNTGYIYTNNVQTVFNIGGSVFSTISGAFTMASNTSDLYFGSRDNLQNFFSGVIPLIMWFQRATADWENLAMAFWIKIKGGV